MLLGEVLTPEPISHLWNPLPGISKANVWVRTRPALCKAALGKRGRGAAAVLGMQRLKGES